MPHASDSPVGRLAVKSIVVTAVALLLFVPALAVGAPHPPIRPGDGLGSPAFCTLNFVFTDALERAYIGTAEHCVLDDGGQLMLGSRAVNDDVGEFGTVVWSDPLTDFALIRLDEGQPWSANVRSVGGPTGVASKEGATTGDLLAFTGHGIGFGMTEQTRHRNGVHVGESLQEFWWDTAATLGDSGAPVILVEDGTAVGIVSGTGLVTHASTDAGPWMAFILERMTLSGLDMSLETSGFFAEP